MVYCVKSVLIILNCHNQSDLTVNESMSALMLFASFDIKISVLFRDAALSLLNRATQQSAYGLKDFLKPANKMVESFEFYDIEQLYILKEQQDHPLVPASPYPLTAINLDREFMMQFDHMISW